MNVKNKGFALLISVVTTAILLLVSFIVINIALKELVLAYSGQESQYSFYNADSGVECAIYWDIKNPNDPSTSAFASSPAGGGSITCAGQTVSSTSPQTIPTFPTASSANIGGNPKGDDTSIFMLNFTRGCVIVRVTKAGGFTQIDSTGYNTCDTSSTRRFERGITVRYQ